MSLVELTAIVPPPSTPVDSGGSWASVEAKLGTGLPGDYKAYIEAFGTGCLDDFIWVFNPFSRNPNLNLLTRSEAALRALKELQSQHADEVSYPLFPAAGGLLPWGATDNGDVLYWLTMGQPDEWSVVVNAARDPRTEQHPAGMSVFLAKILKGAIVSRIFPDDFPGDEHLFVVS